MKPFMRPIDRGRLAPVGWICEPAGQWAGRTVEVVYDPRRHEIFLLRNDPGDPTRSEIAQNGYRLVARDGRQEMWARERAAATVSRLDRLEQAHSAARRSAVCDDRSARQIGARR